MSPLSFLSEAWIRCCTERDIGTSIVGLESPEDVETGFSNILILCPIEGADMMEGEEEEGVWVDRGGALEGGWE